MYLITWTWITTHLPTLRDGWLSWPCWLTDSGRLNHKVVTHPASSLAQDRESSPTETSVLTTMLRRQLKSVSTYKFFRHRSSSRMSALLVMCILRAVQLLIGIFRVLSFFLLCVLFVDFHAVCYFSADCTVRSNHREAVSFHLVEWHTRSGCIAYRSC